MDKRSRDDSDIKASNQAKRKKVTVDKNETISLLCEWVDVEGRCAFSTDNQSLFLEHVESHEPNLEVREGDGTSRSWFCCMWDSCGFDSESSDVTRYHINYHGYHTQIKSYGKLLLQDNPTLQCFLDFAGRNLLPVLPAQRRCEWLMCPFSTNSFLRLIDHVFNSHISGQPCRTWRESVECQWEGCRKTLKGLTELKVHLKSHTQEKTMGCPVCGNQFASKQKLRDHLIRQMASSDRYNCPLCKKHFPSDRFLQEHIKLHVNCFKCPYCEMTCPLKSSLSKHIIFRHLNDRHFKCNFCDHRSKTEQDRDKHQETHCSENLWICEREGCEFSCRSKNGLAAHYNKAHADETVAAVYACHICDKTCNRGSALTHHLRTAHKYRCASGQSRFRYIKDNNGQYKLQPVRWERVEITQLVTDLKSDNESRLRAPKKFTCLAIDNDKFVITEDSADSNGCELTNDDDPDDPEETAQDMVILDDAEVLIALESPSKQNNPALFNASATNCRGMTTLSDEFDESGFSERTEENTLVYEDSCDSEQFESKRDYTDKNSDDDFEESLQKHLGIVSGTGFAKIVQ